MLLTTRFDLSQRNRFRLIYGILALSILVFIPGCIFVDRGLMTQSLQLGMRKGEFAVVACDAVSFRTLLMESRVGTNDWITFWELSGAEYSIPAGGILSASSADELGLDGPSTQPDLGPNSEVAVSLGRDGQDWDAFFTIPPNGLSDGDWLTIDGLVSATPCEP